MTELVKEQRITKPDESLIQWLERTAPGFTQQVVDNVNLALAGGMKNVFQWKATEKVLDSEFSKAPTKLQTDGSFDINLTFVPKVVPEQIEATEKDEE